MEGDDLGAEQVLAGGDVGDGDRVLALVGDQVVDGPLAVAVALLGDLDPAGAGRALLGGGHVDHDGAQVGRGDDVVAGVAVVVVPLEGELVAGLDLEGLGGGGGAADVAGHGGGGDIGDGVVVGGAADVARSRVAEALVLIVDPRGENSGVGVGKLSGRCQSEHAVNLSLHGGERVWWSKSDEKNESVLKAEECEKEC